jgi:anti-anti-sigma regulatory factor
MEFEYKINEMKEYLVITLKGKITRDCKDNWQACFQECLGYKEKNVVVVLKDVIGIDHSMSRDFALFQQDIRKSNKAFYLMGLKLQLRQDLDSRGLVRIHEIKNTLDEILMRAA